MGSDSESKDVAQRGPSTMECLTLLQSALTRETEELDLDQVTARIKGLYQALEMKKPGPSICQEAEKKRMNSNLRQSDERRREDRNLEHESKKVVPKNKPKVRYGLKYHHVNSEESKISSLRSESENNSGDNLVKQRKKKRNGRKKAARKY